MKNLYIDELIETKLQGELLRDEPLAPYMTWKVGGPAKYFYKPASLVDLSLFLSFVPKNEPIVFIGWGSNLLVSHEGFDGTVISMRELNHIELRDENVIYAEAGALLIDVCRFAAKKQLGHFEKIAAIPGTVGGALAMNAGAYGDETWQFVEEVKTINRHGVIVRHFPHEYEIGYRGVNIPKDEWFVSALFKLPECDEVEALRELQAMLELRASRQPLEFPNAGSVFRNPPNDFSARLIEASGLKGYRVGGASVSVKHVNFIVNDKGATFEDILAIIHHVRETVREMHAVQLLREVRIIDQTGIHIDGEA